MPYKDLRQANPSILGIRPKVNLEQANWIAALADQLAQDERTRDKAWAIAISQFKKVHTVRGNVWKKREEVAAAQKEKQQMADLTKTINGKKCKASDFLVVEDPQQVSTWHLPVSVNGTPDHNMMGAAAAALTNPNGFRGQKYSGPKKAEAISKLKALYKKEEMSFPAEMKVEGEQGAAAAAQQTEESSVSENGMEDMTAAPMNVYSFAQLEATMQAAEQAETLQHLASAYQMILQNIVYSSEVKGLDKVTAMRSVSDEFFQRLTAALSADTSAEETAAETDAEEGVGEARGEMMLEEAQPLQLSEAEGAHASLLQEAEADKPENSVLYMEVQLIRPGWGNTQDNNYYAAEMLRGNANKFVGAKMFETDHNQAEKNTRTWVSTVTEIARFTDDGAPVAKVAVHDPDFAQRVRNLQEAKLLEKMECSILALGKARAGFKQGDRIGKAVDSIEEVLSVDWVTKAGAGGKALALQESAAAASTPAAADAQAAQAAAAAQDTAAAADAQDVSESAQSVQLHEGEAQQEEAHVLTIEAQRVLLAKTRLPAPSQLRLLGGNYTDEAALQTAVQAEAEYIKQLTGSGSVFGQGESHAAAHTAETLAEIDKRKDAVNRKYFKS